MENEFVTSLIIRFATEIPSILIWIIGFSLSLYFRKKNPQKYLLATIAFAIFFLTTIGNSVFSTWVVMNFIAKGEPSPGLTQMAVGFLSTLGSTIAWVILFFAIFGQKYNSGENIVQ